MSKRPWSSNRAEASATSDGEGYVAPWVSAPRRHTVAIPFAVPLNDRLQPKEGMLAFKLVQSLLSHQRARPLPPRAP